MRKRFRWPPKDFLDIQAQTPQEWLNELDIPQDLYDLLLVIIGQAHYVFAEAHEHHLRLLRLEKELQIEGTTLDPLESPLIAPFEPQWHQTPQAARNEAWWEAVRSPRPTEPLPDADPPDKRARDKEIEQEVRDRMHPIPLLQRIVYPWLVNDIVYRADISNDENIRRKRAAALKVLEALHILEEGE